MPKEVEVEFPVIVTVRIPDGYNLTNEEIQETAWDVVSQQCSICIEEREGQPVEWASCVAEILTDESKITYEHS
jgi:hypothetical protein